MTISYHAWRLLVAGNLLHRERGLSSQILVMLCSLVCWQAVFFSKGHLDECLI